MTETPSEQPLPPPRSPIAAAVDPASLEYWCYACDKVVPGETHVDHPGIVCQECENWYIEFIGPPPPLPTSLASYPIDQRRFGKQFLEALRRFSRLAQYEEDPPPPVNQPPSSAIHYAQVFGHHCLYVLRFSSEVGDRGVVDPPNQLFRFDVCDLRSRSEPSFTFNPIDELRAGEQFLHMLRLISQGARDDVETQNQVPSVVDVGSDQSPFCTPLYSFLREEHTFGGRFLRMLCLITQIARDEEVESPNQLLNDSWDLVEQIIGLYEPENFINSGDVRQEEVEEGNGREIEGEEDGDGNWNGNYIRSERRVGGNSARLNRERWENIDAGIEVANRDDDQRASFRGGVGGYLANLNRERWTDIEPDDDQSPTFREGVGGNMDNLIPERWANIDPDEDQSASFRGDIGGWANIDPEDDQSASIRGGVGGNLARLNHEGWENIDRDNDLIANFPPGIGRYLSRIHRERWARMGVESIIARLNRDRWADVDPNDDQSANFRGGDEEDEVGYEIQDETGGYVGNPGDYLDASDYETLLQILAENVDGARPGAPPASKDVVEALETLRIKEKYEILACAICQDSVNIGEIAKKLPCGHGYHEDCIVPWLGSRNSCPLCRYELPTDFLDYEEKRKKKVATSADVAESSSRTTTSGDESRYDTEDEDGDSGGDS